MRWVNLFAACPRIDLVLLDLGRDVTDMRFEDSVHVLAEAEPKELEERAQTRQQSTLLSIWQMMP